MLRCPPLSAGAEQPNPPETAAQDRRAIAVLVVVFPAYSETFVTGELQRLRRRGVDVRPVVLARSRHTKATVDHELLARLRREGPLAPHNLADLSPRSLPPKLAALAETLRSPRMVSRLAVANARMPILPDWPRRTRLEVALLVRRWLRRSGINRLHCHWTLPSDVALLLNGLDGTRFSMTIDGVDLYLDPLKTGLDVLRLKLERAELVIAGCDQHRAALAKLVPESPGKVKLVRNGVDLALFDGRRDARDGGPPLVLSVGRLAQEKRFELLLRACRQALDEGLELRCVIVGEGPERPKLELLRARLGLEDCVQFVGAAPPPAVRDWLSRADLFALAPDPETHFGIPVVFLEAMAMGVPVLGTRLPPFEELSGAGTFVEREIEFAQALLSLLGDPPRMVASAAHGRAVVVSGFDAERWADRHAELLSDARGEHG